MASQSVISTIASTALRQELSDVIVNIDPTETPFISNIGKGKTSSYKTEWIKDTLAAAALNQQTEAAGVSSTATIGAGTKLENYITISAKWFDISDVLEAADAAGNLGRIAYQTAKHLKELARDMEFNLINEATGSSSSAYKSRGLKYWQASGSNGYYGFSGAATSNLLTEDIFTARQQAVWAKGGKVDFVLAPAAQKRRISSFNGANRLTVNTDMSNKKILNVVDFVENDFGVARIYLERHIEADSTDYDWMFFLQKDLWKLLNMLPVKVEKLARTGLSQVVQISTTYSLRCGTADGNASIRYLYNL
jgi:hypothetical protein